MPIRGEPEAANASAVLSAHETQAILPKLTGFHSSQSKMNEKLAGSEPAGTIEYNAQRVMDASSVRTKI